MIASPTTPIIATSPLVRQSARKVRLVTRAIQELKDPGVAMTQLGHLNKRAALAVRKTLSQAVANAVHNLKLDPGSLSIKTIEVNEGPTMKRVRFGGRGRVKPILKRTSTVTVTLTNTMKGD